MNGPGTTEGYALSSDSFDIESGLCGWGKLHLAYQAGVYWLASNSVGDVGICHYDENEFSWIECSNGLAYTTYIWCSSSGIHCGN